MKNFKNIKKVSNKNHLCNKKEERLLGMLEDEGYIKIKRGFKMTNKEFLKS